MTGSIRTLALLAVSLTVAGVYKTGPGATRHDDVLAVSGGTLVDVSKYGTGTADLADTVVVIRNGRIDAVGPGGSTPVPAGARVIDATGGFVVPGLHDVFATVNNQAQANAFLYMGVTSIVGLDEPGGRRGPLFLGAKPGPHVHRLEVVTGYDDSALPSDRGTVHDLITLGRTLSDEELTREIDSLADSGIDVLLLYYTLAPDQLRRAAAHARARGLATIGELGATTYAEAIDAGVMAFVHTSRYSLDLAPPTLRDATAKSPFGPPRRDFYRFLTTLRDDDSRLAAHAKRLAEGHTALIPTLAMNYLELPGHANPWKEPVALLLDPKDIHLPADRETGEQVRPADAVRDAFPDRTAETLGRLERAYCRAGATYLAGSGTDAFGTMAGISLHIELASLVDRCLTPRQALAAATSNVAERFGWTHTGKIEPGADADVLVLDADPTKDIANLKRIRQVILGGRPLDRGALLRRPD
jgi:hypothetical protein